MLRRRRAVFVIASLLVLVPALAEWVWLAWQRRDLEHRVSLALTALLNDGSIEVVNETIQRLTGRREWRSELRLLKGGVLLRRGKADAAMRQFLFVSRDGEHRIPLLLLVGKALYVQGELVDAEDALRTVVREQPDNVQAHRWLAQVYHEFGSARAAITELEQVLRLLPDDYLAYQLLASTCVEDLGDFEKAIEMYRRSLQCNPPEPQRSEIRRELARCLLIEKDYSGALLAVKDMSDGPLRQVIAAECHWGLGEFDKAQGLLDRVDETHPDDDGVLLLGAVFAIERGDAHVAVTRLQKLLERNPQNFVARHQLSLAYQSLGDTAASKAESERMRELRSLQMRREVLHAKALQQPDNADVRDELATVCEQLGQQAEAARWRRNAEQSRKVAQTSMPSR